MGAGHQLRKLGQIRGNNHHGPRWIEYLPKHWSMYTFIFSTTSLLVFCFSFYEIRSSSTSHRMMPNPGRELDALRAQVGDSYLFYLSRLSPTEIVTKDGISFLRPKKDHLESESRLSPTEIVPKDDKSLLRPKKDHLESELMKEKWREKRKGSTPKQKIGTEELIKIKPEIDVLSEPSSTKKYDSVPVKSLGKDVPQRGTDLEAINVVGNVSTAESRKQSTGKIIKDSKKQESTKLGTKEGTKEGTEESTKNSTNESTKNSTNESMKNSTNESTKNSTNESTKNSTNKSRKNSTNESTKNSTNESTNESTKGSIKESTKESTKESAREGTKESEEKVDKGTLVTEEVDKFNRSSPTKEKIGASALTEEGLSTESPVIDKICDFSKGEWVYDEKYPLYKPNTCPYVDRGFRCVENGRPSDEFQKWRWQPAGCDLPRFDAKKMLQRLRGSRMVFVGDSLGRNDFESMMCMLSEVVPDKTRIYETNGGPGHITKNSVVVSFRFDDYDCTIEYYRSTFLVPQGDAPPETDPKVKTTLKLDQIDPSASQWKDADILVLNSGHWWTDEKTVDNGDYFQIGENVLLNMTVDEAFRRAMKTVARFTEKNIDPATTQVFFRSFEPHHFKGGTWDHGGTCNDDSKPLQKLPFVYEDQTCNNMILKVMGSSVNNHVNFLNITYMSELRPDGHNSIWQNIPNSPINRQDCSHWCLPGVPDAWNEILFANLLRKGKGNWGKQAKSMD